MEPVQEFGSFNPIVHARLLLSAFLPGAGAKSHSVVDDALSGAADVSSTHEAEYQEHTLPPVCLFAVADEAGVVTVWDAAQLSVVAGAPRPAPPRAPGVAVRRGRRRLCASPRVASSSPSARTCGRRPAAAAPLRHAHAAASAAGRLAPPWCRAGHAASRPRPTPPPLHAPE